jgi:hypothetical protein
MLTEFKKNPGKYTCVSHLGGVVVSVLALDPKVAG